MKIKYLILGFFVASFARAQPARYGDQISFNSDNQSVVSKFVINEDESREEWRVNLSVCWKSGRASFCNPPAEGASGNGYEFRCRRSQSALCPDPACETTLNGAKIDGVTSAVILKGDHRDFVFFRGSQSGCGGTGYDVHVVGETNKIACRYQVVTDWSAQSACLDDIYANPFPFLEWTQDGGCKLDPHGKKALTFFNACSLDAALGGEIALQKITKGLTNSVKSRPKALHDYLKGYGTLLNGSAACLEPVTKCARQKKVLAEIAKLVAKTAPAAASAEHAQLKADLEKIIAQPVCLPTRKTPATCI